MGLGCNQEGFEGSQTKACGCDPWSEYCVVPPRGGPSYGCIRSFDDDAPSCGGPAPNDGHWVEWGYGHGHPLTAGHSEKETVRIASAVFGSDSDNTRLLKDEAIRRDARKRDAKGKKPPKDGAHDLALHLNPPKPVAECGNLSVGSKQAIRDTEKAVYSDPVTTYTDTPIHLPTQEDLHPDELHSGGRCRPSVTGIFKVCGPYAARD